MNESAQLSSPILVGHLQEGFLYWAVVERDHTESAIPDNSSRRCGELRILEHGHYELKNGTSHSQFESLESEAAGDDIIFEEDEAEAPPPMTPLTSYDESFIFIGSSYATSLEFDLPFSDQKKAEQVLPLQVEDILPYDAPLSHRAILPSKLPAGSQYRYHMTIADVEQLKECITDLSNHDFRAQEMYADVFMMSSLIAALATSTSALAGSSFAGPHAYIFEFLNSVDYYFAVDGNIVHARSFALPASQASREDCLESQLSMSFGALLPHYGYAFEDLSVSHIICEAAPDQLNRIGTNGQHSTNAHSEELNEIMGTIRAAAERLMREEVPPRLAWTAAALSVIEDPSLTKYGPNLRTEKLRYVAPFTDVQESVSNERIFIWLFLLAASLYFYYSYQVFETERTRLQERITAIAAQALGYPPSQGTEVATLEDAMLSMQTDLGELTRLNTISSLEWLTRVADTIPASVPIEVSAVSIDDAGLTLKGSIPDITTEGRISSLLAELQRKNEGVYCTANITSEAGSSRTGESKRSVTIRVELCK